MTRFLGPESSCLSCWDKRALVATCEEEKLSIARLLFSQMGTLDGSLSPDKSSCKSAPLL